LKYGKCHWSGDSTTPSSEMNRPDLMIPIVFSFGELLVIVMSLR
jgi:hypothetical protein